MRFLPSTSLAVRLGGPLAALTLAVGIALPSTSQAVPSFARQTGFSCSQCHTQFPELTPFGRAFKAGGYTMSTTKNVSEQKGDRTLLEMVGAPPLSVMLQASYTHTAKAQGTAKNDDVELPQQLSLFYAGKIAPKVGAFIQLTYDGTAGTIGMDNTDIRFAHTTSIGDKAFIFGLTLNNNPTVQDLWNTTPAWGFPWAAPNSAPGPAYSPLIAGTLAQNVAGLGAYALWDNLVYGEVSLYHAAPLGVPRPVVTSTTAGTPNPANIVPGVAPYWRLAIEKDLDQHSFEFGTYGMAASLYPGNGSPLDGPTNHYVDTALDAQYQYIGEHHIATLMATWIHENSFLDASTALGLAGTLHQVTDTYRVTGSYLFDRLIGARLSYFSTNGTSDTTLYTPSPIGGSLNGSPFSNGLVAELSYTPWLNTKLVAQYTAYFNFNGSSSNYDGSSRSASDNNTVYLLAWLSF